MAKRKNNLKNFVEKEVQFNGRTYELTYETYGDLVRVRVRKYQHTANQYIFAHLWTKDWNPRTPLISKLDNLGRGAK